MSLSEEFVVQLRKSFSGEVHTDAAHRLLYSTDASNYQIEPLGVAFPRCEEDLLAAVALCAQEGIPLLARGAGSSLAGQAVGRALVLDCSRHLNRILSIDPEAQTAEVEPGVILSALNRAAGRHGLQFGPDPASADRATMGGSIANNASGAHSISHGMTADQLLAADVVLADGSPARLGQIPLDSLEVQAGSTANGSSIERNIHQAAAKIRSQYGGVIEARWPRIWRNASGYTLNYLLPWSASRPAQWPEGSPYPPSSPGYINLAPLLAGSEGTLAVIRRAVVRMSPVPKHTLVAVIAFADLVEACEATPDILEFLPSAVELIPRSLMELASMVPAYARQLSFLDPLNLNHKIPAALLVVEFSGDDLAGLKAQAAKLGPRVLLAESPAAQNQIWTVRKAGLGILMSKPGDLKAVSFIEDISVPVERLGEFVREMQYILEQHQRTGEFYAHASAGCLHMRTMLDLKSPAGVKEMRSIASEALELVMRLGGTMTGEHGDGLARGEWLERVYGKALVEAFRLLKNAADPEGILNPGKIVDVAPMEENLRFGVDYHARAWQPVLDFSRQGGSTGEAGLLGAIEHCNGAGVCRKAGGVMCPSFQASQDEMHSTRGRANLLRAMVSGRFPVDQVIQHKQAGGNGQNDGRSKTTRDMENYRRAEQAAREALDLCLACKGCQSECPSGVDVARLKYEFMNRYYRSHRRPLRDYLFGYIGQLAPLGSPFASLAGAFMGSSLFKWGAGRLLGISPHRQFPRLARKTLGDLAADLPDPAPDAEPVLFLPDTFTEYFHPENGVAALQALLACGCRPILLPVQGTGRTLISKGFLEAARRQAVRVMEAIQEFDPDQKLAVVGVEPSEIYTLKDEFIDLLAGTRYSEQSKAVAERAWMVEEYLLRPRPGGTNHLMRIDTIAIPDFQKKGALKKQVLLHGHCYQKAQPPAADGYPTGVGATAALLEAAGFKVKIIDAGCCGMAGAFGYEQEHYEFSMKVGEDRLFPAVRSSGLDVIIAAAGVSCQPQIEDGTGREVLHPMRVLMGM